jgi:hypothetical protein
METLKDILWPIVLVGGLGALIDFLIGRTGQEKAKDFLLKWWVRFDDVRWKNLGREEGLFAGRAIERWFGRRIWSSRRIEVFFILFIPVFLLLYFMCFGKSIICGSGKSNTICFFCWAKTYYGAIVLLWSFLGFSVSVSFTKFITFRMAYLCGMSNVRNLIIFLTMLVINYLMLEFWSPITSSLRWIVLDYIIDIYDAPTFNPSMFNPHTPENPTFQQMMEQFNSHLNSIDNLTLMSLPNVPSIFRFVLSIVFVGSFLLRPLIMRPVNLVWRRIIEASDNKPVFTLIFGGAATFATAISELAKHLWG